jgi:hypothetical protein
MWATSLMPISFSVPPYFGVPGFSPLLADPAAAGADPLPLLVLLAPELLQAAASTVTATAVAAPTAFSRKCFATLFLLKDHSA